VVISEVGLKRALPKIWKLEAHCTLIAEESLDLPETAAKVIKLPIESTAKEQKISKLSLVTIGMGALLEAVPLFPEDAFQVAMRTFQYKESVDDGLKAIEAGRELVQRELQTRK
jgi:Pyruvate/2-oxoacid:ferredoxin oxidoreductase gamma subunit